MSHRALRTTTQPHPTASLGLGIERLGLIAARHPWVTLTVIVALTCVSAIGLLRLETDDSLNEFFRSSSESYREYQELKRGFPVSGNDVLVVVEADSLKRASTLESLRDLQLELLLVENVIGVLSLFSVHERPRGDEIPPPLIPETLPEGEALDQLIEQVRLHPFVGGRLLSTKAGGAQTVVFIVEVAETASEDDEFTAIIHDVQQTANTFAVHSGLKVGLTGIPVMKLEIGEASRRDRIVFNVAGFCVGLIVCLIFFRRLDLVVISNVAPIACVLWTLGLFGFCGIALNPILNAVLPLLMVIAFTNSMHLVFEMRAGLQGGLEKCDAIRRAILSVGPACIVTTLTTMLALLSIALADSELIRTFGLAAAGGMILTFLAVILCVPTLAVWLLPQAVSAADTDYASARPLTWLDKFSIGLAHHLAKRCWLISIAGLALFVLVVALYLRVDPYYRLTDITPRNEQAHVVSERLEKSLTGIHPVQVLVRWPANEPAGSERILKLLGEVDQVLRENEIVHNVWSIEKLRRWIVADGVAVPEDWSVHIEKLPPNISKRMINESERAAVVSGFIPDLEAHDVLALKKEIEGALRPVRVRYPDFELVVSSVSVMSATAALSVIEQLNRSLLMAIVLVIVCMTLAFRSLQVGLLSLIPNLFALAATGALLYVLGWGLEYAGIIALTVAFGLAVDDTIHVFNRFRNEAQGSESLAAAVERTIARIGPILILTTIVLVFGISVSALSVVPPTKMFGQICVATLVFALLGDLILLPALMLVATRFGFLQSAIDPGVGRATTDDVGAASVDRTSDRPVA